MDQIFPDLVMKCSTFFILEAERDSVSVECGVDYIEVTVNRTQLTGQYDELSRLYLLSPQSNIFQRFKWVISVMEKLVHRGKRLKGRKMPTNKPNCHCIISKPN